MFTYSSEYSQAPSNFLAYRLNVLFPAELIIKEDTKVPCCLFVSQNLAIMLDTQMFNFRVPLMSESCTSMCTWNCPRVPTVTDQTAASLEQLVHVASSSSPIILQMCSCNDINESLGVTGDPSWFCNQLSESIII